MKKLLSIAAIAALTSLSINAQEVAQTQGPAEIPAQTAEAAPAGGAAPADAQAAPDVAQALQDQQAPFDTTILSHTRDTVEVVSGIKVNGFWKNWEMVFGAGAQFYMGENDKYMQFGDRLTPCADLMFTKWASPSFGVGINFSGWEFKGLWKNKENGEPLGYYRTDEVYYNHTSPYTYNTYKFQHGYLFNPHIVAHMNFCNVIGGYKEDRFCNVDAYIGGGVLFGFGDDLTHYNATFNAGVMCRFRLGKQWDFYLNFRGLLTGDDADGESQRDEPTYEFKLDNIAMDGMFGATAGFIYKFNNDTKRKPQPKEWMPAVDRQITDNVQMAIVPVEQQIKAAAAIVIEKTKLPDVWFHINFDLDKWKLTNREKLNLDAIADIMKVCPEAKFTVRGYADIQTASAPHNKMLGENRAQAVYDYLVKVRGVNPEQLLLEGIGGVDTMFYGDSLLSRCVLIESIEKTNKE